MEASITYETRLPTPDKERLLACATPEPSTEACSIISREATSYISGYQYAFDSDDINLTSSIPTDHELKILPRVAGKIKSSVWTIAFAELMKRFSYHGALVLITNFIQHPLPPGSTTGASDGTSARVSGALGMGQKAAQGISLFMQCLAWMMPIVG